MNKRGWLTLGAAVAATASVALAGSVAAGAATSAPASSAISRAGTATSGTVLGVVPARGARPLAAAAAARAVASCSEPDCNLPYHGGPVQTRPRVYVVFWGPKWKTNGTDKAAMKYLTAMYKGLGQAKDALSLTASQYADKSGGHPAFGTSVLAGTVIDAAKPEAKVSFGNLETEAKKIAGHFKVTNLGNAQIVIAAQSGTCFATVQGLVFVGNCGKTPASPPSNGYCGYHSATGYRNGLLSFTNLPFQLDAGMFCGENFLRTGSAGTLDGFSMVGGHEFAESVTDPDGNGWIDYNDFTSGGEIADKCAWEGSAWGQNPPDPAGVVGLSTGHFAMQSLWSNVRHGCVMNGKLPLIVKELGNRTSTRGKAVGVQVSAHTTPKVTLTFHATGLPRGLSIGLHNGLIHGTPSLRGTFHVRVSVAYYAGSFGFSFTWRIS